MATNVPNWTELLREAIQTPGMLMQAYTAFHAYSVGNQLLALWQCGQRGLPPGPLNTYPGWQKLGRQVKKGEKALTLLMPVTVKEKHAATVGTDEEGQRFTTFIYKPHWFVLTQTAGPDPPPLAIPAFDADRALASLGIKRLPFEGMDGNCQGYARGQGIAISPLAQLPHKTFFHETGHVVLGHTAEGACLDGDQTPRNLREIEAESVALIGCESLGLEGAAFCRGYIQAWLAGAPEIPEKSAQKIFRAADLILRAGTIPSA